MGRPMLLLRSRIMEAAATRISAFDVPCDDCHDADRLHKEQLRPRC